MGGVTLLVAFLLVCGLVHADSNVPMSPCTGGRITFYDYVSQENGACGFGALSSTTCPTVNVAAPNQLFYNNASHCGECWELTGPSGSVVVMVADECPATSENPLCYGDMDHFDLGTSTTFGQLAPTSVGDVLISKRQVACPFSGNVGVLMEKTSSIYWLGLLVYNHKVGITAVEIQNGGTWYSLPRASYNYWHYDVSTGIPNLATPFNVRVTGQTGQQITWQISNIDASGSATFTAASQFIDPQAGYGGSSSTPCSQPAPAPWIYTDGLYYGGADSAKWSDWSYGTTPNWACTTSPKVGSYCACATIKGYSGIQLGRGSDMQWSGYYTNITFYGRADTAYSGITVSFGDSNPVSISLTTEWQLFSIGLEATNQPATVGNSNPLVFKNNENSDSPQIYLDQIEFTPLSGFNSSDGAYGSSDDLIQSTSVGQQLIPLFFAFVFAPFVTFLL